MSGIDSSTKLRRNEKTVHSDEESDALITSQCQFDIESRRTIANQIDPDSDFDVDTNSNSFRAFKKSNRPYKPHNNAIPSRICALGSH
jgi:hypothetical protein